GRNSLQVSRSSLLLVGGPDHTPGTTTTPKSAPAVVVRVEHAVSAGLFDYQAATRLHHGQEEAGGISEGLEVAVRDRPPGHLEVGVGVNPIRPHPPPRFSELFEVGGFSHHPFPSTHPK